MGFVLESVTELVIQIRYTCHRASYSDKVYMSQS